jgi:fumarate reductase flavoprotein subunit
MMGGVEFAADCSTALTGLFVAGEDAGGVHGANRLGGNGVANSTVFGAVAGDSMAAWVGKEKELRDPDLSRVEQAIAESERPFKAQTSSLEPVREQLYELMWQKVGIIRDAAGLRSALSDLNALEGELDRAGVADGNRAYNLTWHDWLNLKSLVQVSRVVAEAALARTDSRGAHFREDFPEAGPLDQSAFTSLRLEGPKAAIQMKPVAFTRVRPGQSLLVRDL